MDTSTEKAVEMGIKYGAVFAEVGLILNGNWQDVDTFQLNPITKAIFGVAGVTFEVRVRHWRHQRQR